MFAIVVVVVEPVGEGEAAFGVGGVDAPVCPFGLEGPVEALYLAVLPGAVGPDRHMAGTEIGQDGGNGVAVGVGPVIVGHHRFDVFDPDRGEERSGSGEESGCRVALLISVDLAIRHPGVVIDG